jgi:membrane associated rhomboid family serine protease
MVGMFRRVIPLRDRNPTLATPYVTYALIAINVVAFVYEFLLGAQMQAFVERWGVVPYFLTSGAVPGSVVTLVTSMFLHGGWAHLIGNMWFLFVFGDNVEDRLGRGRFLIFYFASGFGAALLQVLIDPSSTVPMVGASGAISGVLGAYAALFPGARVLTLVPIFVFIQFIELPALLLIAAWFVLQLVQGLLTLGVGSGGGIAFFAHIGGFVAGLALIRLLKPKAPARTNVYRTWRED